MKVFISWSGHRSHEVADALNAWLKKVIQVHGLLLRRSF